MNFDYDLLVIGAGPGGLAAAKQAAGYGVKVAVVEKEKVGGTCVVHGCIPEKLMAYAANFSHFFADADEYGWGKVQRHINWQQFMTAKNKDIEHLSQLHIQHLQQAGAELIYGQCKFLDIQTLDVKGRKITASKILIAVGGKSKTLDITGREYAITSRDMFDLKQQPEHIAIIGSDQIAVKFAGTMNALISKVSLIVAEESILHGRDQDIQNSLQKNMEKNGIQIFYNTNVNKIEKCEDGLRMFLSGNYSSCLTVDTVLCAVGRVPNLSDLDLEKAGIKIEEGAIAVDEYSRTNQANIFAIGDCTNRQHWTPVALASGRAFADTVFGNQPRCVNFDCIPAALSSQPEAATVGLTEAQAREKFGESVRCYCQRFQPLFHSIAEPEEKTMIKLVVDGDTDRVIGAHMVGEYATEIIQCLGLAIKKGVTKKEFDTTIGIHPSAAEEFFTLH